MATWVRSLTGTAPTGTDANVTGTAELGNATAPADFAANSVTSVRVQMTVSVISGTFETGGGEFHTVYHDWNFTLNGNGTVIASGNGANGTLNNTNSSSSSDVTDSTGIPTGLSIAQWEGAELNYNAAGDFASGWTQYTQNKGKDGVRVDVSAVTVTITYTPFVSGAGSANTANTMTAAGQVDAPPPATYELREWRFRDHSNFEVAANSTSWGVAQDTAPSLSPGRGFRLRVAVAETAGSGATAESFKLQYQINSGAWTDVAVYSPGNSPARTSGTPGQIAPVEIRRIQATSLNDTATTQLLSSPDTFAAGQLKTSALVATASPDASTTEIEWALWFHRWANRSETEIQDGDTITFRVQWDNSGYETITPVGSNPSLSVSIPDYFVGGIQAENIAKPGGSLQCDSNGNLYCVTEVSEPNALLLVHKSTDGGVTWQAQDVADGPTYFDIEGCDTLINAAGDEYWIFCNNGSEVRMFRYGLSTHATTPDQWIDATGELVATITAADQSVCAFLRSDGTVLCAYTAAAPGIDYKIRSTGGTWGSATTAWSGAGFDDGVGGVLLPSNDHVVLVAVDASWSMYAKLVNGADDSLDQLDASTAETAAANGTGIATGSPNFTRNQQAWLGLLPLSSSSCLVAYVVDAATDAGKTRVITGIGSTPSVGSEQASINSNVMVSEIGNSKQPMGAVAIHPSTGDIYAVYATETTVDSATNTFRYRISDDNGATWGTEQTISAGSPGRGWGNRIENAVARIYTRGGGTKLGVAYADATLAQQDDFTSSDQDIGGNAGDRVWFWELDVSTATLHSGAGSANQANQATASGASIRNAAGTASQATEAVATSVKTINAAATANQAVDATATGSTATVHNAVGSADQAAQATGSASVDKPGAATASQAAEAVGVALVERFAAGSANTAVDAVGAAVAGALISAAGSADTAATATATATALFQGAASGDSANGMTAAGDIIGAAVAEFQLSGFRLDIEFTKSGISTVDAAGSANQASDATATATVVTYQLAAASADSAVEATAATSVLRPAAATANSAVEATANGQISGLAQGQGSADQAVDARAAASVLFQAAGSADQATDAVGSAVVDRYAAGSADQASDATASAFREAFAAGSADQANEATGSARLDISAAGSANATSAMAADGQITGIAEGRGSANQAVAASASGSVTKTAAGSADSAVDATATASRVVSAAGSANSASDATATSVAGALISGSGSASQSCSAAALPSVIRLGSGSSSIAVETSASALKDLFGAAIATAANQTIGSAFRSANGWGSANTAQDATAAGFILGQLEGAGSANAALTAVAGGFSSPAVTDIDGLHVYEENGRLYVAVEREYADATRTYTNTTRTYEPTTRSYQTPDESDNILGEPEFT